MTVIASRNQQLPVQMARGTRHAAAAAYHGSLYLSDGSFSLLI